MRRLGPALAGLLVLAGGCRGPSPPRRPALPDPIRLTRVTESAGLSFRHEHGESGRKWFPEWLGSGCAWLDFDQDGWQDLFVVNGGRLPGWVGTAPTHRLYRNLGGGRFADVTAGSGLESPQYGVGVCSADYDGDSLPDLYVTGFGVSRLYRNLGAGRFRDVTAIAGAGVAGLTSGAAFADYDGDGDLDLYVCRYVRYSLATNVPCYQSRGSGRKLIICRQVVYDAAPDEVLRNDGGRFRPVGAALMRGLKPGRGLGAIGLDIDGDGGQEVYVANDLTPNFLFRRVGNRWTETAFDLGVAVNHAGQPQAGMGVAAGDVDGDGRLDLAVTNFAGEYTALYLQEPDGRFQDSSAAWGLIEATAAFVGFGVGLVDLDLDGRPDLFAANGHVSEDAEQFYEGVGLKQAKLVLRHEGTSFRRLPNPWSEPRTGALAVGRGAAFADYDNDGDLDAVVSNLRGDLDLLRNDSPGGKSLRVSLRGRAPNPLAIGATVRVRVGTRWQVQPVASGGSYCSQNELRLVFGLGAATAADEVQVVWPNGARVTRRAVPPGELRLRW
jgi:hypothetical protein